MFCALDAQETPNNQQRERKQIIHTPIDCFLSDLHYSFERIELVVQNDESIARPRGQEMFAIESPASHSERHEYSDVI